MAFKRSLFDFYYEWWKNVDKFILFLVITLFIIGLFFSLASTSLIVSDKLDTNDYSFFFKHLIFIFLGTFIIFSISSINQEKLFKLSIMIFIFSIIFLILVPFIGVEVKGSKRWIDLYFLPRFQPIELVKPFLIIFISLILTNQILSNNLIKYSFSFIVTFSIAILLIIQPDIGQTILILGSWLILVFTSGVSLLNLSIIFLPIVSIFF